MNAARKNSRSSGRVTLNHVAELAGVSPITVSRALRGERQVATELVLRVRQAAEQLGYVPDPAARALATSRSSHVAVLIPLLTNTLFVDLLEGVQRSLLAQGYQTIRTPHTEIGERAAQMLVRLMRNEPVEAASLDLGYRLVVRGST